MRKGSRRLEGKPLMRWIGPFVVMWEYMGHAWGRLVLLRRWGRVEVRVTLLGGLFVYAEGGERGSPALEGSATIRPGGVLLMDI